MFLMESVKKRGGTIRFLKSESSFISTKQADTLGEFIRQRRRWTSKSPAFTDFHIIVTACIILAINALSLSLLTASFFNHSVLITFGSLFFFKYALDTFFLYAVSKFFQLNNIWYYSLLLSAIYPFYIVFVAFSTFLFKPKKWK